jgi:hypothetical protein
MYSFGLACVLAKATVDWTSCSRTKYFIIFTILWAMNGAYVPIEIPMFLNTQLGPFTGTWLYTSWAIYMIWWAKSWAIGSFWTVFSFSTPSSLVAF